MSKYGVQSLYNDQEDEAVNQLAGAAVKNTTSAVTKIGSQIAARYTTPKKKGLFKNYRTRKAIQRNAAKYEGMTNKVKPYADAYLTDKAVNWMNN